jgi:hypothetical protein
MRQICRRYQFIKFRVQAGYSCFFTPVYISRRTRKPNIINACKDIIYWADNLSRLLIKDVFADVLEWADYNKLSQLKLDVNFWLD